MSKSPFGGEGHSLMRGLLSGRCLAAVLIVAVLAVSCFVLINDSDDSDANLANTIYVADSFGTMQAINNNSTYTPTENVEGTAEYYGGVLTLRNYEKINARGAHTENGVSAGIYCAGDLELVLEGSRNSLKFSGESGGTVYGIYVAGNLTIKNKVTVDTTLTFDVSSMKASVQSAGIYCSGKLTVINESVGHSFTLKAIGGTHSFDSGNGKSSFQTYGILCGSADLNKSGSTIYNNELNLTATGGDISVSPQLGTVESIGLKSINGAIDVEGNTTITNATGGKINISGYTNNNPVNSAGIFTEHAFAYNPTVANRSTCTGGDIYMTDGSTFGGGGISYGIRAGSLSVSGKLTATGGMVPLALGASISDSYGIWAYSFTGNHATVIATANDATRVSCGFYCYTDFDTGVGSTITCRGNVAPGNASGAESAGLVCSAYTGRSGSNVTGYSGNMCYGQMTSAGVRVNAITLYDDARLKGVGGDTFMTYTPEKYVTTSNVVTQVSGGPASSCGVYVTGNSVQLGGTSVLTGTAGTLTGRVTATGGSRVSAGVYFGSTSQDSTISGTGTVNATGGTVVHNTNNQEWNISAGVYCYRGLTIDGVTIDAEGGSVCTDDSVDNSYKGSRSYGLYASALTVTNHAVITAEGGANGCYSTFDDHPQKYNDSIGLFVTSGDLTLSGFSALTATGKGAQRIIGIIVGGDVSVDGSSTITVSVPLNVTGGYISDPEGIGEASIGIYLSSDTSSFSVPSGTVILTGMTQAIRCTDGNTGTFSGVEALWISDSLTGEGAEIIASSTHIAEVSSVYVKMDNTFSVVFGGGWVYGDEPSALEFSNPGRVVSTIYTGTDVFGSTYYSDYSDVSPPTNAGDYTVTIRYDGDNVKSFVFSITPRAGGTIAVNYNPTPRYTGSVVVPEITLVKRTENGVTTELDPREYQVTNIDPEAIAASLEIFHSATVVLNGNYQGSKQISYRILTVFPEASMFNIPEVGSVGYTGESVVVSAPTLKSPMEGCGSITVKYAGSTEPPKAVGSYYVTFDVSGGSNIQARTNLPIGTLVITPYTVSFNGNGAEGTMLDVTDVAGAYTLPVNGFTVPAGKVFSKWAAGSAEGTQYDAETEYNVVSDITFYAIWEDIVYHITFDSNGGTGSMATVDKTYGQIYELPGNGFTPPTHYEFKCWMIGETEYPVDEEITIKSDVVVKAVWQRIVYTVNASIDHGTVDRATQNVNSGEDSLEITFTAADHYAIKSYFIHPSSTSISERPTVWRFTVTNVTGNVNLVVNTIRLYDITLASGTGYTLSTTEENGFAYQGGSYTFSFALKDGYTKGDGFAVKVNGTPVELTDDSYTITGISGEKTVTVIGVVAIEYSIEYDLDGGEASNPEMYTVESDDIVLAAPTRTGYTFGGWTGTGLSLPTAEVKIASGSTGDRSYTATWQPNTYTVIWKNGDDVLETDEDVEYGTIPEFNETTPVKEDYTGQYAYTFAGWALSAGQESGTAVGDLRVTGDMTYYAAFSKTVKKYTATFDLNGGSVESTPTGWTPSSAGTYTKTFDFGTAKVDIIDDFGPYSREGYSETSVDSTVDTMGAAGMTITVNWEINQYAVTFNLGGYLVEPPYLWSFDDGIYTKNFNFGTPLADVLADFGNYSREGYFKDPETSDVTTVGVNGMKITAHWTIITYRVDLNLDGGVFTDAPDGWDIILGSYCKSFDYNTPYSTIIETIVHNSVATGPAKEGYTFTGWSPNTGNLTTDTAVLTAQYSVNKYTAAFDLNGGSVASAPEGWALSDGRYTKDFDFGTSAEDIISNFGEYTRTGFDRGTEAVSANTMGISGMTITAQWLEHALTVTFMGNGSTGGEMSQQVIKYSDAVKTLKSNAFVKTRYHFTEWKTVPSGSGTSYANECNMADLITSPNGTLTLYAQWVENSKFTVTFDSNEGSVVESQLVYDGEYAERPTAPEKVNFVFAGWYTDDGTFANAFVFETTPITSDIELYAKWDNHEHQLEFHAAVAPTCTQDGNVAYWQCTQCGTCFSDSEGTHELASIVDPATGHEWGAWTVTVQPTCTAKGTETRYCENDHSHTESQDIDMIPHTLVAVGYQEATCTEPGHNAHWVCSVCGKLFSDSGGHVEVAASDVVIPALGHDLVPHGAQEATCTEPGWDAYDECSRCDYTTYHEIAALGHAYSATYEWSADGKTCTVHIICARDAGHNHDIPVTATSVKKTDATFSAMGVTTYSVSGTYDSFAYANSIDIADIPYAAKEANGSVEVITNTSAGALTIAFDGAAVSAIGAATGVTLKANVVENSSEVPDAKLVIEITLVGATFSEGKAKVSLPFSQAVPEGKVVKVYFINGDVREDMNAALVDGKVIFETNHFSTYAVFFEDASSPSGNNGGGFPIWIVFVIIAVVIVAGGAGAFFVMKNKKA